MAPFVPGYASSPVQVPLGRTFGAVTIGVWAGCILFGMNFLSTIHYIGTFPQDPLHNKLLVAALSVVNIVYIVAQCEMVFNWTISNWGNLIVLENTSWGWQGAVAGLSMMALIVQCYFAFRIWVLSGRKGWWISVIICLLSATSFGFACGTVVVTTEKGPGEWGFYTYGNTSWLVLAAAADVVITVSMIVYLLKARTGFSSTERLVKTWIIHALETNAVTATGAIVEAILVAISAVNTDASMLYVGVAFAVTQLYPLAVLTALNSRTGLAADRVQSNNLSGLSGLSSNGAQKGNGSPRPQFGFNPSMSMERSGLGGDSVMIPRALQEVHVLEEVGGEPGFYDERDIYSKHPYSGKEDHHTSFGNMVYVQKLEKARSNGAVAQTH